MDDKPVLKIDDLCYSYGGSTMALEHVSFEIRKNDFVAIIGQNGAGKSTILKNITGLLRPTEGHIYINGRDSKEMSVADISKEIGFVLQNPDRQLFADTVYEELAYGLRNAGLQEEEIKSRIAKTLEMIGMTGQEEMFPPALSKGDRAKVVIASVIAMNPGIVILDEPTSGQDFQGCYQIMNIAKELHDQGHTILFVTHHMPLVAEYAERTIVMAKRHVMMDAGACEVFSHPEELEKTNIRPPQITQLGQMLAKTMPLTRTTLRVEELGDDLMQLYQTKHSGNNGVSGCEHTLI